jgi:hypothetical protein
VYYCEMVATSSARRHEREQSVCVPTSAIFRAIPILRLSVICIVPLGWKAYGMATRNL